MLGPSDANVLGIHHDANVLEIMTNGGGGCKAVAMHIKEIRIQL